MTLATATNINKHHERLRNQTNYRVWGEKEAMSYKNFTFSQTAIEAVLRDIRNGNDEFVKQFFAARPEWLDGDEKTNEQTDEQQSEKKVAQA